MKFTVPILLLAAILPLSSMALSVAPENAVVLYQEKEGRALKSFAALELQKHLSLLTGKQIPLRKGTEVNPGEYPFFVGVQPASDTHPLKPEEGRFLVTPKGTYLYGNDVPGAPYRYYKADSPDDVMEYRSQTGTLFGVLEFLEKQFDFRWIEPGDQGIAFTPAGKIELKVESGAWDPGQLVLRRMRYPYETQDWEGYKKQYAQILPKQLMLSKQEFEKNFADIQIWTKRQRMGRSLNINYGHAFTDWRKRFLESHPDYFATDSGGKVIELTPGYPFHFQLCVSNPAVHLQILADFRKNPGPTLNVCENDGAHFCECPRCKSWDCDLPGSPGSRTDRYVKFANVMQDLVAKEFPGTSAVFYAYERYRLPPNREKVDPRIIIGFVPELMEMSEVENMYQTWRKAGANRLFLRPNDQHINTGMPMGFERQMYTSLELGRKYGIIGTDYDSLYNFWNATGLADYVIVRGQVHPERSFEDHENEYASAFGAAAPEVLEYYRYWRHEIWEKRLVPNRKTILERGRFGNYRRGVIWDLPKYYKSSDFDKTDAILNRGLAKKLSDSERERLNRLLLANRQFRLVLNAISATDADGKLKAARELLQFRIENRNKISIDWAKLIELEKEYGDTTGTVLAETFNGFAGVRPLPMTWNFKIDPTDQGIKEKWFALPIATTRDDWARISLYAGWEVQPPSIVGEKLARQLKDYDGIGFYALAVQVPKSWRGRRIFLTFGAVDESAWVYLNGKFCGDHVYRTGSDDWKTPFTIEITRAIDWNSAFQHIVVRVEDRGGQGGIWKSVYLTMK